MTLVSLGEVVFIVARQVDPQLPQFASLPLTNGENIEPGTTRLLFRRSARDEQAISPKYEVVTGDVVYSKLRPYLRKVVVADEPGLCSADLYPLRPDQARVDPHWLAWMLVSERFTRYASQESARARMPKLNREQLLSYRFDLPPLGEQRSVAFRLGAELGAVDRARFAVQRSRSTVDSLRTAAYESYLSEPESKTWPRHAVGSLLGSDLRTGVSGAHATTSSMYGLSLAAVRKGILDLTQTRPVGVDPSTNRLVREGRFYVVRGNGRLDLVGRGAGRVPAVL
jgi:type I restriction enzyme S subunit